MPKIRKLKIQLSLAIFILIIISISGIFIFGPSLVNIAKALTGNYSKSSGEQLTNTDWNTLSTDFLDKQSASGDTMAGPLTLGGPLTLPADPTNAMQAATKQYVDDSLTDLPIPISDTSGMSMKMVCGVSPDNTWVDILADRIRIVVDTSAAGFTTTPLYFTTITGDGWHYDTTGASSIYFPTPTGFFIQIYYGGTNLFSAAIAASWHWRIQWCGVGT